MDTRAGPWLFSALDDGSGSVSCERVLDFWHREGFTDAGAILQALGLDRCATVSLDELCRLVDEQLPCAGGYAAQALLVACKHEVAQLRSWLGELGTERDVLRACLRSARLHAEQLARDADEQLASASVRHCADLRHLEQVQAEALAALRGERERELERVEQAEDALQEELERLHAERQQLRAEAELAHARCSRLGMELADARARCASAKCGVCDSGIEDVEPGVVQPSPPGVPPLKAVRPSRQALNKTNYYKLECNATPSQENAADVRGTKTSIGDRPGGKLLSKHSSQRIQNPSDDDKLCQQGIEERDVIPAHLEQLSKAQFSRVPDEQCREQVREKCDKLTHVGRLASAQSEKQSRDQFDKAGRKHSVKETKERYRQVREQTVIEYREQTKSDARKPCFAPTETQVDEQCDEQLTDMVTELSVKKTREIFTKQQRKQLPESVGKESTRLAPNKQTTELTSAHTTKLQSEALAREANLRRATAGSESSAGHSDKQTRQQSPGTSGEESGDDLGERARQRNATAQSSEAPLEESGDDTGDHRASERPQKFSSPSSRHSDARGNSRLGSQGPDARCLAAGPGATALSATLDEAASLLQRLEVLTRQLLHVCCPQGTLLLRVLWSGLYSRTDWIVPPLSLLYGELAHAQQLLASARRQCLALSAPDPAAL